MDARGYDPNQKRTRYHQFNFNWFDFLGLLIIAGLFALTVYYSITFPTSSQIGHIPYIDVLTAF
jgi:energy-coupling factor transport system permease protein